MVEEYKFGDRVKITKEGFFKGAEGILTADLEDGNFYINLCAIKGISQRSDIRFMQSEFEKIKEN